MQSIQKFELKLGTRQGCPLSPLLFAIAIEPFAVALRHSSAIKGIVGSGIEHKVSLYADDALIYISDPLSSITELLTLLQKFGRISGYKVNLQKSELMPVTSIDRTLIDLGPFKISSNKFKYLGIWITRSHKYLYKANFLPLLVNLRKDIARWNSLPLSMGGRTNLIKMTILPKFFSLFQNVPVLLTKSFFSNLNGELSAFICNKKHPRIGSKNIATTLCQGLGGV